jgi:hypothetical protein
MMKTPLSFHRLNCGIILAVLCSPCLLQAADEPREISYSIPAADFQKHLDKQFQRKLSPRNLVAYYVSRGRLRAAGIWQKQSQGESQVRAGLTRDELKKTIDDYGEKGFRLAHLSGTGAGGPEKYTAIWEKAPGQKLDAAYGVTDRDLMKIHLSQAVKKNVIHRIVAVEIKNQVFFTAVWENDETAKRELELGMTVIKFRKEIRTRTQAGFRIRQIFVYVLGRKTRYACIWEKSDGPKQQVSLNQTLSMMKKTPAKMKKDGLQPSQIHAYSLNGRERFVVVWEQAGPSKKP